MFGVLPIVFSGDGIVRGRLRELAITVVAALPLALVIGRRLLARLRRPRVARGIWARTIATVAVTLGYHFGLFMSPRARQQFGSVAVADGVWA